MTGKRHTDRLLEALARLNETPRLEYGTVTSTAPFKVLLDAAETPAPATKPAAYAPVNGDRVALLLTGADRLVLFKI